MTKNYCDYCKEETTSETGYVKISTIGSVKTRFHAENVHFCEKCYTKLDALLKDFISKKKPEIQVATT